MVKKKTRQSPKSTRKSTRRKSVRISLRREDSILSPRELKKIGKKLK